MQVTPYQTMRDRSRTWWAVGARWLSGRWWMGCCVLPDQGGVEFGVCNGMWEVVKRLFAMGGGD
jgi:hypothetical protein